MLDRRRFVGMGCSGKASLHLGYDEDAPFSARCLFSNRLVVPLRWIPEGPVSALAMPLHFENWNTTGIYPEVL